jgi:hypothetical protein
MLATGQPSSPVCIIILPRILALNFHIIVIASIWRPLRVEREPGNRDRENPLCRHMHHLWPPRRVPLVFPPLLRRRKCIGIRPLGLAARLRRTAQPRICLSFPRSTLTAVPRFYHTKGIRPSETRLTHSVRHEVLRRPVRLAIVFLACYTRLHRGWVLPLFEEAPTNISRDSVQACCCRMRSRYRDTGT